jgi:hypothetical protein
MEEEESKLERMKVRRRKEQMRGERHKQIVPKSSCHEESHAYGLLSVCLSPLISF